MPVEGCCQTVEISLPRPVWAALDLPMEASYALIAPLPGLLSSNQIVRNSTFRPFQDGINVIEMNNQASINP